MSGALRFPLAFLDTAGLDLGGGGSSSDERIVASMVSMGGILLGSAVVGGRIGTVIVISGEAAGVGSGSETEDEATGAAGVDSRLPLFDLVFLFGFCKKSQRENEKYLRKILNEPLKLDA